MHLRKISTIALISILLSGSTISFANEVDPAGIESVINTNNIESEALDEIIDETLVSSPLENNTQEDHTINLRNTSTELQIGVLNNIYIPKWSESEASFKVTQKGTLSLNFSPVKELVEDNTYIVAKIYNSSGKEVSKHFIYANDWGNKKSYIARVGLEPGSYKLELYTGYEGDITLPLKLSFTPGTNIKLYSRTSEEEAQSIKLGYTYTGTLSRYDYDFYKINVSKDTKVTITAKSTQTIQPLDSNSKLSLYAKLGNNKSDYGNYYSGDRCQLNITLKPGTNYIRLLKQAALTDYELTTKIVTGPFNPNVDTVGDSYTTVSGSTEKGTRVYVKVGTGKYTAASVNNTTGNFYLKTGKIKEGTSVYVYAVDSKGNKSDVVVTKSIDTTPPKTPTINKYTVQTTVLKGTTEANAEVRCRIGGEDSPLVFSTKADDKGVYKFKLGYLNKGTKIEVQAFDKNQNRSYIASTKVHNYVKVPTASVIASNSTAVSGTSTKGTTVYIKLNGKNYKAKTNSNGKYSITIPKQKTNTKYSIWAADSSNSTSKALSGYVVAPPSISSVSTIKTSSTKVTGKATANTTISIKANGKYYTGKVSSRGNFSVSIPKQKKGSKVYLNVKNSKGVKSNIITVTVK